MRALRIIWKRTRTADSLPPSHRSKYRWLASLHLLPAQSRKVGAAAVDGGRMVAGAFGGVGKGGRKAIGNVAKRRPSVFRGQRKKE